MSPSPDRIPEGVRRRLLRDMGIEAWYARSTEPDPCPADSGDGDPATGAGIGGAASPAATMDANAQAVDPALPDSGPGQPAEQGAPAGQEEPPFAIVALGVPGTLLLVDAFRHKQEARLARDVVRAVRRDWSAAVAQARFDWPQPGASGASAPAVAAFIEKQAEDHGARVMLVSESVAARLGKAPFEFVTLPDPASLGEARNKLALWRHIQKLAP